MKVAAIVLAAGESRRMGCPKQTLPYGGSTMLGSVISALRASNVEHVLVVLGYNADEVRRSIPDDISVTLNPRPQDGMLSSAQWGLSQLPTSYDAYLFALADQPSITVKVIDALISAASSSPSGIFMPSYEGKRGHPLLVRSRYREAILALPLTGGLNQHREAHKEDVELVPVDTPFIHLDIDTPEEYDRALKIAPEG